MGILNPFGLKCQHRLNFLRRVSSYILWGLIAGGIQERGTDRLDDRSLEWFRRFSRTSYSVAGASPAGASVAFSAGTFSPFFRRAANWCLRSLRLRRRPAERRTVPFGGLASSANSRI